MTSQGLNIVSEYKDGGQQHSSFPDRGVPGVPRWMVKKMAAHPNHGTPPIKHDLDHWNHYANIPYDDLTALAYDLQRWRKDGEGGSHTQMAMMAAVLVYRDLQDKFPNERVIRDHVRSASYRHLTGTDQHMQEVRKEIRKPQFFCPRCNEGLHDRRSARWHCKGFEGLIGLRGGYRASQPRN